MTVHTMTATEQLFLEKCRDVEMLCYELYEYFSTLYAADQCASDVWRKTADEELNHANQFTLALKLNKALSCKVNYDLARVESVASQLRIVLKKVRRTPPLHKDALLASIQLEQFVADLHLNCVVEFDDAHNKSLFNALMASDHEHIEALQAAYNALSVK